MYETIDTINSSKHKGLKVEKLLKLEATEILSISIEAGDFYPTHKSSSDATLLMLEGVIIFQVNGQEFELKRHQLFQFPKDEDHAVVALDDSKFLIIR